jgi:hypothetical protein
MQKSINSFIYGDASTPVNSLLVTSVLQPVVVLTAFPQTYTNSAQASFQFRVDSLEGNVLNTATVYYRLSPTDAYIDIGLEREIPVFQANIGLKYIDFKAEINGQWSDIVTYQWTVDTAAPTVASVTPINEANDVGVQTQIEITFDENVQATPITQNNAIQIQPSIAGSWTGSGATYTFTPSGRYEYATEYTVVGTSAIKDMAGNIFTSGEICRFATIERTNEAPSAPDFDGITNISRTSGKKPQLIFNIPDDVDLDRLHFTVEVTNVVSGQVRLFASLVYPDSFVYYPTSGTRTVPFPTTGVVPMSGKVVFKTPIELDSGEYAFKVFADDRR